MAALDLQSPGMKVEQSNGKRRCSVSWKIIIYESWDKMNDEQNKVIVKVDMPYDKMFEKFEEWLSAEVLDLQDPWSQEIPLRFDVAFEIIRSHPPHLFCAVSITC